MNKGKESISKNNLQDLIAKSSSQAKINQAILIIDDLRHKKYIYIYVILCFFILSSAIIHKLIIKRKYLSLQEVFSNAYLIRSSRNINVHRKDFIKYKKKLSKIANIFNKYEKNYHIDSKT